MEEIETSSIRRCSEFPERLLTLWNNVDGYKIIVTETWPVSLAAGSPGESPAIKLKWDFDHPLSLLHSWINLRHLEPWGFRKLLFFLALVMYFLVALWPSYKSQFKKISTFSNLPPQFVIPLKKSLHCDLWSIFYEILLNSCKPVLRSVLLLTLTRAWQCVSVMEEWRACQC